MASPKKPASDAGGSARKSSKAAGAAKSAPAKLGEYEAKRDFDRTPEPGPSPEGRPPWAGSGLVYLIHEHHARALHFDLRLEWEGVLLSWAVPKGPSLDPKDKRLAVHVEDHPLEYGTFEGEIPAGEYGAGSVIIWDCGTWQPIQDPALTLPKGELKFILHGQKLHGAWMLVRMKPRPGEKRENWLLFKERDDAARPDFDTLAELPGSVSDTCLPGGGDASAGASSAGAGQGGGGAVARGAGSSPPAVDPATLPGARKARMPAHVLPMLATLSDATPEGARWVHEVKFDGYRALARLRRGSARMISRNGLDWTERFGGIGPAVAALPAKSAILDGEVTVLGHDGASDFGALQEALSAGDASALTYQVFDLLYLDGYDLTGAPLLERKRTLAGLLRAVPAHGPVRYTEHIEGHGETFHRSACEFALEGVVSKLPDSTYVPGRSRSWIKSKCAHRQEFVVGGWAEGAGARSAFGALLVGFHDGTGALHYAGRVGTGFDDATVKALLDALLTIETAEPPFTDRPTGAAAKRVHWVRPLLVAEVAFAEWTRDGVLRQPSFKGLRDDKAAADVVLETGGAADGAPEGLAGSDSPRRGPSPASPAPPPAELAVEPPGAPLAPPATSAASSRPVSLHGVKLTHPERRLFTDSALTKLDVARYYEAVAERMLPHVTDRPLTLMRCPHGMAEECFYQRHVGTPVPRHVRSVPIPGMTDPEGFIVVNDLAGVLELLQLGALEFHGWGCRASDPDRPDRLIWDLDPDEGLDFGDVADAARLVRMRVESLGLAAFLDATGGKGLHVVVPIVPELSWRAIDDFAKALAEDVARVSPRRLTTNMRKDRREGGLFIDYVRNTKSSSAIVPYSTRARSGAPVCTPVTWEELERLESAPRLAIPDVLARLAAPDPWAGFESARAPVTPAVLSALGISG